VRESLKGQDLSFTEIAKIVGEKWQVLPADEREGCERQANAAKEKYYAELAEYKKTPHFEAYQKYLEDFKAKHSVPTKGLLPLSVNFYYGLLTGVEGKRSKLETETSTSTRAGSNDMERNANRSLSSIQPEPTAIIQQRQDPSQPIGPSRLPAGPSQSSKPTFPTNRSLSGFNSPRSGEQFSPVSASPRSAALQREGIYDTSSANLLRDPRPFDANPYLAQPAYNTDPRHQSTSTTPPYIYSAHYQAPGEFSSRRSRRESARLPPLTHEDTTLSSESSHSGSGFSMAGYPGQVPPADPNKTMRMLPQPVPSIGPSPSPLDRPVPSMATSHLPHHPHDYRTQGPLAVLVRAGELASRAADEDVMETEGSP
jgi:hypothetical protein